MGVRQAEEFRLYHEERSEWVQKGHGYLVAQSQATQGTLFHETIFTRYCLSVPPSYPSPRQELTPLLLS